MHTLLLLLPGSAVCCCHVTQKIFVCQKTLFKICPELNLTYIFITHDITAVTYMCDKVIFLHDGAVVENIRIEELAHAQNDYAKQLLHSVI